MEERFKEFDIKKGPRKTNFKKWAFKFLVYIILLNVLVAYMMTRTTLVITPVEITDTSNLSFYVFICSLLATLLLIAGVLLTILSVARREEKNYQYYISLIGYPIFIILTIISNLYLGDPF